MNAELHLQYTPDLAEAVEAVRTGADGLTAQAVPLADLPAAVAERQTSQVCLISAAAVAAAGRGATRVLRRLAKESGDRRRRPLAVVLVGDEARVAPWQQWAATRMAMPLVAEEVLGHLQQALEIARLRAELAATRRAVRTARVALAERRAAVDAVHRVGIALSAERDVGALRELILSKSRELTAADAGSLYLLEGEPDSAMRRLRFELAHNDSQPTDYHRFTLPLSPGSLAGYVALTGEVLRIPDVYHLPSDVPYRFNRAFDQLTGYRTRSMLLVPMHSHEGDVVGVIQLINRKRHLSARLDSAAAVAREVIPFDDANEQLLRSFASQAAVALDNQQLLESIQRLFDGFVNASVQAIEARDPTTSGHSQRVAALSVALAEAVNRCGVGPLADLQFTPHELRELRYAGLLHDFGKVGVREHVLLKAKKLYDWQLRAIEDRFAYARAALVARHRGADVDLLLNHGPERYLADEGERASTLAAALAMLEGDLAVIRAANEPTVLPQDCRDHLTTAAGRCFLDLDGTEQQLLGSDELALLSIARGSLDERERHEIESHVTHTIRFLSLIPWTRDLKNVGRIAGAHHEKLNGSGYPHGLSAADIPMGSRIMAIADIYDALNASDRPYKRAVPTDVALRILRQEADGGFLDPNLLDIFAADEVYRVTQPPAEPEPLPAAATLPTPVGARATG